MGARQPIIDRFGALTPTTPATRFIASESQLEDIVARLARSIDEALAEVRG
jgi:hypothetical protein